MFRALAVLVWLSVLLSPLAASQAHAEAANPYGTRGRTILSGSVSGFRSNTRSRDDFGHGATAWVDVQLTLLHFWADNFALGGTVIAGSSHLGGGSDRRPWLNVGGDIDAVYHVPLSQRLSLRFWLWEGVRWNRDAAVPLWLVTGLEPELLVHLSSSTALTFGPELKVEAPLQGRDEVEINVYVGPGMTYSLGPDEASGSRLEDARLFARRGRRALQLYASFDKYDVSSALGFLRFVVDGFGVGFYLRGGETTTSEPNRDFFGAGVQVMLDVPFARSASLLLVPKAGYQWKRSLTPAGFGFAQAHELQLALPAYVAVHLHEALVVGIGPELAAELRLAETPDAQPNDHYVRAGVSSVITGSF